MLSKAANQGQPKPTDRAEVLLGLNTDCGYGLPAYIVRAEAMSGPEAEQVSRPRIDPAGSLQAYTCSGCRMMISSSDIYRCKHCLLYIVYSACSQILMHKFEHEAHFGGPCEAQLQKYGTCSSETYQTQTYRYCLQLESAQHLSSFSKYHHFYEEM